MNDYDYKIRQLQLMLLDEEDDRTGGYGAHLSHWAGKAAPINIHADAIQALIDHYENAGRPEKKITLHTYDLQTIVIALIYYQQELESSKYRNPSQEDLDRVARLIDTIADLNKLVREENNYNLDIIARA